MKGKRFLTHIAFALVCASALMPSIKAMQPLDEEQKQTIAPAINPTFYLKYWPLTLTAYAATGYAFYNFDQKISKRMEAVLITSTAMMPLLAYHFKKENINIAISNAKNENNIMLANRLESFKYKNAIFGYTNMIHSFIFIFFRPNDDDFLIRDKLILLGGSLAINLLVDHWGTKEDNIPE